MSSLPSFIAPIPEIPGVEGRKTVKILECGERLVPLTGIALDLIAVSPEYALRGYRNAVTEVVVRERVAKMLRQAAELLPHPYKLLVWDGWRPRALQEELFAQQFEKLRQKHPEYSIGRLVIETEAYVSLPSSDPSTPAPHSTGGAVDLTICDAEGKPVEMGTDFDHFGPEAGTRYFEERLLRGEKLTKQEIWAQRNRRLLFWVMTAQGFTNYREEWWHFDFGDQLWGKITGRPSIYGVCDLVG